MASTRRIELKDGSHTFEVRVSRGRGKPPVSTRWRPKEGWCARTERAELAKFAAEFERQVKEGEAVRPAEKITVQQFAETVFLPLKEKTVRPSTLAAYRQALRLHIIPAIGDTALQEVTPSQLQPLLLNAPDTTPCVLSALFKLAYRQGVINANPMERTERPRKKKKEVECLTREEAARLLECLKGEPLLWRAVFTTLLHTGLRRGELCGLRWQDVDLKKGTASINGSMNKSGRGPTKTGVNREVFLSREVVRLLKLLRESQPLSQWVFCRPGSGEFLRPNAVDAYCQKFREKHGFPGLHPHTFRHTFISLAIAAGVDVAAVSSAAGHTNTTTTLAVYTHANPENVRRAFEAASAF